MSDNWNYGLDIPPERDRTDVHRKDIHIAWLLVDIPDCQGPLNSTEGHLAVLRGIQYGRKQELKCDGLTTSQLVNEIVRRLKYDGHDAASLTLGEISRALDGVNLPL